MRPISSQMSMAPPADELDEDGYQRPGAAARAPAVLPVAALQRFRLGLKEQASQADDDSLSLLAI